MLGNFLKIDRRLLFKTFRYACHSIGNDYMSGKQAVSRRVVRRLAL